MSPVPQQEDGKVVLDLTPEEDPPTTAVTSSSKIKIQRTASALDIHFDCWNPQAMGQFYHLEIPFFCIGVTVCFVAAGVVGKSSDSFLAFILVGMLVGSVGCFLGILILLQEPPMQLHIDTAKWHFGKTKGTFANLTRAQETTDIWSYTTPGDCPDTSSPVKETAIVHSVILYEGLVEHQWGQWFNLSIEDAALIARLINKFIADHRGLTSAV